MAMALALAALGNSGSSGSANEGTTYNINLPTDLSIDDIKDLIDYIEGKKTKAKIKSVAINALTIPAMLATQWQLEKYHLSPPALHLIMQFVGTLETMTEGNKQGWRFPLKKPSEWRENK